MKRDLGKYQVIGPPPGDTSGRSYLALYRGFAGFQKVVVLREVMLDLQQDDALHREFLEEVRVAAAFSHPNIARVHDLEGIEGGLVVAVELSAGATLAELADAATAAGEPLPVGLVLMAIRDAALALHYAHSFVDPSGTPTPVAHCAINAKSILVTYEGITQVLDFGLPKAGTHRRPGDPADSGADLLALGELLRQLLAAGLTTDPTGELIYILRQVTGEETGARAASGLEFARTIEAAAGSSVWKPEQAGAYVERLFGARHAELREALVRARGSKDMTAVMSLGEIYGTSTGLARIRQDPADAMTVVGKELPSALPPERDTDPGPPPAAADLTHPDFAAPPSDIVAQATDPGHTIPLGSLPAQFLSGLKDVVTQVRAIPGPPPGSRTAWLRTTLSLLLAVSTALVVVARTDVRYARMQLPEALALLEGRMARLPTIELWPVRRAPEAQPTSPAPPPPPKAVEPVEPVEPVELPMPPPPKAAQHEGGAHKPRPPAGKR